MKPHIVQQTKHLLFQNIRKPVILKNTWNCMGPLKDENKLQIDETVKKN